MLIEDIHNEFKVKLDKIDSSAYPDILPEEIDIFLRELHEILFASRSTDMVFSQNMLTRRLPVLPQKPKLVDAMTVTPRINLMIDESLSKENSLLLPKNHRKPLPYAKYK